MKTGDFAGRATTSSLSSCSFGDALVSGDVTAVKVAERLGVTHLDCGGTRLIANEAVLRRRTSQGRCEHRLDRRVAEPLVQREREVGLAHVELPEQLEPVERAQLVGNHHRRRDHAVSL